MSHPAPAKPPIPTLFTIVAVLLAVALIAGAYMFGRELGTPAAPSASPTPAHAPEIPESIGGFSLAKAQDSDATPRGGQQVARGNYTDGKNKLVLMVAYAQQDLEKLLTDGGVTDLQEAASTRPGVNAPLPGGDGSPSGSVASPTMCGKSTDTGFAVCGRLVDQTGQLLYAATDVPAEQLVGLLAQVPA